LSKENDENIQLAHARISPIINSNVTPRYRNYLTYFPDWPFEDGGSPSSVTSASTHHAAYRHIGKIQQRRRDGGNAPSRLTTESNDYFLNTTKPLGFFQRMEFPMK
jgi:hypothetical protein